MQTFDCLCGQKRIEGYAEDEHAFHRISIAAALLGRYDPPVRLRVLPVSAFVILVACQPPAFERSNTGGEKSSQPSYEDANATLDVTPEPFAEPAAPVTSSGTRINAEESPAAGTLVIGDGEATPLAIAIYLHPSSPYSREFQRLRMPKLIEEFVEPGLLTIQLITLPIDKYPGTDDVVRTTMCAADQNKGYAAHVRLFEAGATALTKQDIETLELDSMQFESCFATMTGDVLAGTRVKATQDGITLVPSYVIRGDKFIGLPTEADLLGAIRAAL